MSPENVVEQGLQTQPIKIAGETFEFVDMQRDKKSVIYNSADAFLRIGEPEKIKKDLDLYVF